MINQDGTPNGFDDWSSEFTDLCVAITDSTSDEFLRLLKVYKVGQPDGMPVDYVQRAGRDTLLLNVCNNTGGTGPAMAQALVDLGANLEAVSEDGDTPLLVAASSSKALLITRLLLEAGADVLARSNQADQNGESAVSCVLRTRSSEDDVHILSHLVNFGASLKDLGSTHSALALAVDRDCEASIRFLIEAGEDPLGRCMPSNPKSLSVMEYAKLRANPGLALFMQACMDVRAAGQAIDEVMKTAKIQKAGSPAP